MKAATSGKSKKWLWIIPITALLVAGVAYFRSTPDPMFRGKKESQWIAGLISTDDPQAMYNGGLRARTKQAQEWKEFGPEGVQVLIRGLDNATHPVEKAHRQIYDWLALRLPVIARNFPKPKIDGTRDERRRIAGLLSKLARSGHEPASVMRRCLDDEDSKVREMAFMLFTSGVDEFARLNQIDENDKASLLSYFIRVTKVPEQQNRIGAVHALGYYPEKTKKVVPVLLEALQDTAPPVRFAAAISLQKVASEDVIATSVVPVLIGLLQTPSACDSARLLGELKREPALSVPALMQTVQTNKSTLLACIAIIALSHFEEQAEAIVPALQKVALREDNVGHHAREALKHLSADALVKN
ncbi:MAG: domain containing protein [Verrucomicrobiales bacterium]|nr:domain containing protein [Verrucomicrobiales bacterium]